MPVQQDRLDLVNPLSDSGAYPVTRSVDSNWAGPIDLMG